MNPSKLIHRDFLLLWWFLSTHLCVASLTSSQVRKEPCEWYWFTVLRAACPLQVQGALASQCPLPRLEAAPRRVCPQLSVCSFWVANWPLHSLKSCLRKCQAVFLDKLWTATLPTLSCLPSMRTEQSAGPFLKVVPIASAKRPSVTGVQPWVLGVWLRGQWIHCAVGPSSVFLFRQSLLKCLRWSHSSANPHSSQLLQNLSSKLELCPFWIMW